MWRWASCSHAQPLHHSRHVGLALQSQTQQPEGSSAHFTVQETVDWSLHRSQAKDTALLEHKSSGVHPFWV